MNKYRASPFNHPSKSEVDDVESHAKFCLEIGIKNHVIQWGFICINNECQSHAFEKCPEIFDRLGIF